MSINKNNFNCSVVFLHLLISIPSLSASELTQHPAVQSTDSSWVWKNPTIKKKKKNICIKEHRQNKEIVTETKTTSSNFSFQWTKTLYQCNFKIYVQSVLYNVSYEDWRYKKVSETTRKPFITIYINTNKIWLGDLLYKLWYKILLFSDRSWDSHIS